MLSLDALWGFAESSSIVQVLSGSGVGLNQLIFEAAVCSVAVLECTTLSEVVFFPLTGVRGTLFINKHSTL